MQAWESQLSFGREQIVKVLRPHSTSVGRMLHNNSIDKKSILKCIIHDFKDDICQ